MKKICLILTFIVLLGSKAKSQKDTAVLISGEILPTEEFVVIIGDYLLYDTSISFPILFKYDSIIKKKKYYSRRDGLRKFKIVSKDGILFCTLKKGKTMEIKDAEKIKLK